MKTKDLLKKAVFILLQYFISTALLAQTVLIKQWDKRFGGTSDDIYGYVQQTTDGGYILGGTSSSDISGDKTESKMGFWILKIDANGVKQWDKSYGPYEHLISIQQTTDGGFILGSASNQDSSGDKTQHSRGGFDYFVFKIDGNGAKQWDKRFGGTKDDILTCVQQTTDGGYILGGASGSDTSGDKTALPIGNDDYWIVKIDASGTKQWDKCYGGTGGDVLLSLQQTIDGGYILGGDSESGISGDKTEPAWGSADDYWVVKIDANGGKQWDKRFGGTDADDLRSLEQTTDGGYILGGSSLSGSSGDKTEPSRGGADYWIVKIDASGAKQRDKRFGGTESDNLGSLQQTSDGGYILGGLSWSGISGDKTEPSWEMGTLGSMDYWIVKIDGSGAKQWDKRYGGDGSDALSSLQQTIDGGYILGGYSNSSNNIGDKTQDCWRNLGSPTSDYWIVKLGYTSELDTCYHDADGDGYGDASQLLLFSVDVPDGYVIDNTDCNDADENVHPGASEFCDGIDNNCDGQIDEGFEQITYYHDSDHDRYGDPSQPLISSCGIPPDYTLDNTDCNDADRNVHPGAPELCDGVDNNCDGQIDEGFTSVTYYRDADGDGYGDPSQSTTAKCSAPAGYVTDNTDCNDADASVHPGATEICDSIDNNCDGQIDEGFPLVTYYRDTDGDSYGNPSQSTTAKCSAPAGYVTDNTDCNDANASVHPGAIEICDGLDNNCDGQIDEGFPLVTYYRDADSDGYGNPSQSTTAKCSAPAGYVTDNTDCNDANASVHPGATEICDGIDNNCDGQIDEGFQLVTYYRDADSDGYGNPSQSTTAKCSAPAGYVPNNTDCNDANASVHPGATEICDGIDNNCDGQIDEGFPLVTYYRDADSDGYGNPSQSTTAKCSAPAGFVINNTDCNDANASVHPGATEICDGIDNNCDGRIDEGCSLVNMVISDVSMKEGNTGQKTMNFSVTLSQASSKTITVNYATQNGSATAGSDYVAKSGTLTFNPKIKKQSITVTINGDKIPEANETFNVLLSNAVNATITDPMGAGTILNDDGAMALTSSIIQANDNTISRAVKISPNPAKSLLQVQLYSYAGNVTMQLLSVEGKVLKQEKMQVTFIKYTQQINVADVTNGIYFLTVIDEKGYRQTEKVIVQR